MSNEDGAMPAVVELLKVMIHKQDDTTEAVKELAKSTNAALMVMIERQNETNARLDQMNGRLDQTNARLDQTNAALQALTVEVHGMRSDLNAGLTRQNDHEHRIERLEAAVFKSTRPSRRAARR
jgi:uncharacterized coiled-coil DUF342 family protein